MSVVVPPESLELKCLGDFHRLNFLIFHSASSPLPALPLFPFLPSLPAPPLPPSSLPFSLPFQPFKMWNFLIMMGIFLLIDVAYLSFWTGVYPFRRNEVRNVVSPELSDLGCLTSLIFCTSNFGKLLWTCWSHSYLNGIHSAAIATRYSLIADTLSLPPSFSPLHHLTLFHRMQMQMRYESMNSATVAPTLATSLVHSMCTRVSW